jgi:hypothetical protein
MRTCTDSLIITPLLLDRLAAADDRPNLDRHERQAAMKEEKT